MTSSTTASATPHPPAPVLGVTKYDTVTSFLKAACVLLTLAVTALLLIWLTNFEPHQTDNRVPVQLVGAVRSDGAPNQTLNVESPEAPADDPSAIDEPATETEFMNVLQNVIELSANASQLVVPDVRVSGEVNKGKPGSAVGSDRPPLGPRKGPPGEVTREQRWFVKFDHNNSLHAYAKQLDHFGIELGAYFPERREVVFLKNVSAKEPKTRRQIQGRDNRLFMSWQGGDLRKADLALFRNAGVDARTARIMHFYPQATEDMLARAERAHVGIESNRIRRTYFSVAPQKTGYHFVVTRQVLR